MESPFTFDPANRRVVLNTQQSKYIYPAAGGLYVCSLYLYARRFLRVDRNIVAAGAFAAASLPASYAYSRFFLGSPQIEAALMNNAHEAGLRQQEWEKRWWLYHNIGGIEELKNGQKETFNSLEKLCKWS